MTRSTSLLTKTQFSLRWPNFRPQMLAIRGRKIKRNIRWILRRNKQMNIWNIWVKEKYAVWNYMNLRRAQGKNMLKALRSSTDSIKNKVAVWTQWFKMFCKRSNSKIWVGFPMVWSRISKEESKAQTQRKWRVSRPLWWTVRTRKVSFCL